MHEGLKNHSFDTFFKTPNIKIDQKAKATSCYFQICQKLRFIERVHGFNCFQLYNDAFSIHKSNLSPVSTNTS